MKLSFPSGETGGDLIGRFDIGEGGTKGNDSRMESAVAERTDEPDVLRLLSCSSLSANARLCCSSNVPRPAVEGVTKRPMVVRLDGERPNKPTFTRVAFSIPMIDPACVLTLDGRLLSSLAHGIIGPSGIQFDCTEV